MTEFTHWQHLAICTAITERSFPNYALYCEIEGLNSQTLRKMLNKVWEYLRGQLKSSKNIEKQLEALTENIPDPETKEHYGVFPAMDTALALQSCLQAILDPSIEDSNAIIEMMNERLAEVIGLQTEGTVEIEANDLWIRHQAFLAEIIEIINNRQSHADQVKALIPLSRDHGVSNLGICLEEE